MKEFVSEYQAEEIHTDALVTNRVRPEDLPAVQLECMQLPMDNRQIIMRISVGFPWNRFD